VCVEQRERWRSHSHSACRILNLGSGHAIAQESHGLIQVAGGNASNEEAGGIADNKDMSA
jgi:hypothetical protein